MKLNTTEKCLLAEFTGEIIYGTAIGITVNNTIFPKCNNTIEKLIVCCGAGIFTWYTARKIGEEFYDFCDKTYDTNFTKWNSD